MSLELPWSSSFHLSSDSPQDFRSFEALDPLLKFSILLVQRFYSFFFLLSLTVLRTMRVSFFVFLMVSLNHFFFLPFGDATPLYLFTYF